MNLLDHFRLPMSRAAYNAFLYLSWFLSTKSAYTGQDDSWVYIWGAQYTSSKLYAGHSFLYLHRCPLNGCGSPTVFPRSSFSLGFFSMIDSTPGIYQGGKRIILRKVMILFYARMVLKKLCNTCSLSVPQV